MNEDIEDIQVQIADADIFCIEIKEVEKVAPIIKQPCEEMPDLLVFYEIAKL